MRFPRILLAALLWVGLGLAPAWAEKRVALVIGNGAYSKVGRLPNPASDASAMAALFKSAGFDVVESRSDLDLSSMRRVLRDFSTQVRDADMAVVFFAGHGIEVNGANYLIPVDAVLERDIDVEDETVSLDRVSQLIEPAKRLRLIILDACRDNPFTPGMKRTVASRSIGRGLGRVDVVTADTMIAFAARAGSTAGDGTGLNSPYTAALLRHLATPGLDVRLALGRVRDDVLATTGGRQEPYVYSSLGGAETALVPRTNTPPAAGQTSDPRQSDSRIADISAAVIDSVVGIVRSRKLQPSSQTPSLPNDPQLDELFRDFFNRRGQSSDDISFGSGFIIDSYGIVVTNNHVIADADEITVVLNDGTRLKATWLGKDTRVDLAVLKITTDKPLKAVQFGNSDQLRLGERVIAIGNPLRQAGTLKTGIVSARSVKAGPYDNYIQTDVPTDRDNSGGPLFNFDGEVVGINTAIVSPSGSSTGFGFSVPSRTAVAIIDQLKKFGETRHSWIGMRLQQVTDEIAASLSIKPARGALVAGIDDKGPAKPAGVMAGDVVIKFDGIDIKEMRDLPRAVADTAAGKTVAVIIIRNGREETKAVTLGRLEDAEKPAPEVKPDSQPQQKPAFKTELGLDLADFGAALRTKYNFKDSVKGAVVVGVDADSPAGKQKLSPGDVIVEVGQEAIASATDFETKIARLKRDGRPSALLLVAAPSGDLRFIALGLASVPPPAPNPSHPSLNEMLGLNVAILDADRRKNYKIKSSVKGVVVIGVYVNSQAKTLHLSPGDVVVEVAREAVTSVDDFQAKINKLAKDGISSASLLVANPDGATRTVSLSLRRP